MTPKQRLLTAIKRERPDRLPVTTHHLMPYFLNKYMNGISIQEFFDFFKLDPIVWTVPNKPFSKNEYFAEVQPDAAETESRWICSDNWRVISQNLPNDDYPTTRYEIVTPKGTLSMVLQSNPQTTWISGHLIKNKSDIDLIAEFGTKTMCNVEAVNDAVKKAGEDALIRGHVCGFDIYGQPGCWQDACCLVGTERMIMETYDDPEWVRTLLTILQKRKIEFIRSTNGAQYDIMELGGGDASTTVISPKIFNEFVAPFDKVLIEEAHHAGQRVVYHTCGGMMPILEDIAAMQPEAMETFTPPAMGADVDLAEAKKRIGDKVCLIGGFDQFHCFQGCTPEETRRAVRKCFEAAGEGGGYILAPSDHFFDADISLFQAFADEARLCEYDG